MAPRLRKEGEEPPVYGVGDDLFSIEVHHGGFFVGQGQNRSYVDGKLNWFDYCEKDTWSPLWFDDFTSELGYERTSNYKVYWLLPGKSLADGLRVISTDSDTLVMSGLVEEVKNFIIYFDHGDSIASMNWDDIVLNPISELPKVISPCKVVTLEKNMFEKIPSFYCDVPTTETMNEKPSDEDDSDSEFVDSDYEFDNEDDDLFMDNIDEEVVDEGVAKGKKIGKGKEPLNENVDPCDLSSDGEELQLPDSDDEGQKRMRFKSWTQEDMSNPVFKVGMVFGTIEILRKAVVEYSLKNRVNIKMPRNEKKRLHAICESDCPWNLYASNDNRCGGLMVKRYNGQHNCQKAWEIQRCTSSWLAEKYLDTFRADDKMSLKNFARIVQKDWNLTPSRSKLARARRIAMNKIHGDEIDQYNLLWDYGNELRRTNPGSTFFLNLLGPRFSTLYVSLSACKIGFMSGCRPIICLDGCHIKTKFGGQLLTAVGVDPNDCIYPIAMAVVEVESFSSWKWFLQTLKEDLNIQNTYPWTVMTDKQKGLIPAVQHVFPESEHRFCVRHLYSNFQQNFKGETLKNLLWTCARSSSVVEWNKNMEAMKTLNQQAYDWLETMPPNTWVRAFFSTFPKCDILLNNSCEVFNKYILDAREMPILSMLERIKCQLMTRHYNKSKEVGQVWGGPICPKIRKKIHKTMDLASTCYALPAGRGIFQVDDKGFTHIVDITNKTCTCRRWDLTGIPCTHGMTCLRNERIPIESIIPECYRAERYLLAYGHSIWPCNDKSTWEKVNAPKVLPPVYVKKAGRPPKSRRKQPFEKEGPKGATMSKHGIIITCRYCGVPGHNSAGCELKKAGLRPKIPPQRKPSQPLVSLSSEQETVIIQEPLFSQPSAGTSVSQIQDTMVSQMVAEASQRSTVENEVVALPDSFFIATNRPEGRPIPPTTATKEGKAAAAKRKSAVQAQKKMGAKKMALGSKK